ncbi:cytochrome c biogenesis protein CcsA [Streptomyces sp. NBC_00286]|uniref:cytochrome c biogenesis protein CcsA n=1 Tax=Streptomyces sp. NBC_00286 TaxID=2975701 RepID=UPI003FA6EA76
MDLRGHRGPVWAEAAWGRYWGWDPKETWAFITWVAYAAYLNARVIAGWKGRRAAVLGLVAFATFVFNYYGVNILIIRIPPWIPPPSGGGGSGLLRSRAGKADSPPGRFGVHRQLPSRGHKLM